MFSQNQTQIEKSNWGSHHQMCHNWNQIRKSNWAYHYSFQSWCSSLEKSTQNTSLELPSIAAN